MDKRALTAAAIATALLAAGCAKKEEAKEEPAAAAPPTVDVAAEEQAIRNRSAEWMNFMNARDSASIMKVYSPEVVTIYDGNLRRGAPAVQAALEKDLADHPKSVTSWSTTSVRVADSGDLAIEQGEIYVDPDGAEGKEPATTGAYVTAWEKVDGAWRVFADAGTDNAKKEEEKK
jgi:uncharacterized protein (TIGR02246 family)